MEDYPWAPCSVRSMLPQQILVLNYNNDRLHWTSNGEPLVEFSVIFHNVSLLEIILTITHNNNSVATLI